jgi:hypothetical protein
MYDWTGNSALQSTPISTRITAGGTVSQFQNATTTEENPCLVDTTSMECFCSRFPNDPQCVGMEPGPVSSSPCSQTSQQVFLSKQGLFSRLSTNDLIILFAVLMLTVVATAFIIKKIKA